MKTLIKNKRKHLPKGFLSRKSIPTFDAVRMYYIYLTSLPEGWKEEILNLDAVKSVQKDFGVDYGFGVMIKWGIQHSTCKSKTSSGRHVAMSEAYIYAKTLVSQLTRKAA
jgi:hypothetical protein